MGWLSGCLKIFMGLALVQFQKYWLLRSYNRDFRVVSSYMTLDSHQVSSNFYELLEKPKNKNCFQLCPNSTWNQIFHSNVWYISRLFFQYQFVSIHSNIECDDIKMPLFCCITVDPIEPERIYNSHYGNGMPAMFTSYCCPAEK